MAHRILVLVQDTDDQNGIAFDQIVNAMACMQMTSHAGM